MGTLADRIAGRTKQLVAEVIGDGRLAQEGRAQEATGERRDTPSPDAPSPALPDPFEPHTRPELRRKENE